MRIRSRSGSLALVAGMVATGAFAPVPALAAEPLRLQLQIGNTCVSGVRPLSTLPITVKLLRADGTTRETVVDPSPTVDWTVCFDHAPVIGNKLKMTNGDSSRTVKVPDLTVVISRVTSVVSGHGPADQPISIRYHECYPSGCAAPVDRGTHVNSQGRYRKDLSSSIDIDGSDEVDVRYQNSHLDGFWVTTLAPHLEIVKPNTIVVSCQPRGTRTVRLLSSVGKLRASRSFTVTRDCNGAVGSFRKDGQPVNIHTGDRIVSDLAADASITWPMMSVRGVGHVLSGRCLKDSDYVVFINYAAFGTSSSGRTDSDGYFSTNLGSPEFQPGNRLQLICETSRGDQVRMTRTL